MLADGYREQRKEMLLELKRNRLMQQRGYDPEQPISSASESSDSGISVGGVPMSDL